MERNGAWWEAVVDNPNRITVGDRILDELLRTGLGEFAGPVHPERSLILTGSRALWLAVLQAGVVECFRGARHRRFEATRWVQARSDEIGTFEYCCAAVDLSATAVREAVLRRVFQGKGIKVGRRVSSEGRHAVAGLRFRRKAA